MSLSQDEPSQEMISLLVLGTPRKIEEYNEHVHTIATLLLQGRVSGEASAALENKFYHLMDHLDDFLNLQDPIHSKLYLLVERNFDVFIKLSMGYRNVTLATRTIRFLTNIVMNLNYWEMYNLLTWKPAIYHFLSIIHLDLSDCYAKFVSDYSKYNYSQVATTRPSTREPERKEVTPVSDVSSSPINDNESTKSSSNTPTSSNIAFEDPEPLSVDSGEIKEKKKVKVESKMTPHRVIKRAVANRPSNKSSNYDPDVTHECQLPSADEPDKMCLRRFSRKYELIRHQETVHSKKKKLFKCYVCVKQNPSTGPRIFTRHDTLAKHIRVNHKISGKEAKMEVAYSKKHAEVVDEGDITVHVGRRKTKVDFELRAHMEKKKLTKDADEYTIDSDISDEELSDGDTVV